MAPLSHALGRNWIPSRSTVGFPPAIPSRRYQSPSSSFGVYDWNDRAAEGFDRGKRRRGIKASVPKLG
ncbi:MAG: hypothetical protein ACKN81_10330, partial [Pirellulaceae bacterium]